MLVVSVGGNPFLAPGWRSTAQLKSARSVARWRVGLLYLDNYLRLGTPRVPEAHTL